MIWTVGGSGLANPRAAKSEGEKVKEIFLVSRCKEQDGSVRKFEENFTGNPIGPIGFGQFREMEFPLRLVRFPKLFPIVQNSSASRWVENWKITGQMDVLIFSRRQ
ncbi:hypothetical protein TNIN_137681 [Trichonephila inaurata madagascariensis]|uniref:Uncharacterized protein n=1 Tax=Trichonephila inaurata madagascariensis TaxID=2747483 RepID=A0A8X6X1Y4_9ARAC|nr:hypothetical protein TNIN_137681 [Trichonephila inaurata madagascariensis]